MEQLKFKIAETGRMFKCISLDEKICSNWAEFFNIGCTYNEVKYNMFSTDTIILNSFNRIWYVDESCFELVENEN